MCFRAAVTGALYAALLVAAGTVLGVVRTLLLAPALGEAAALALELPVMIVLAFGLSALCVDRAAVSGRPRALAIMAATALATLATAEIGLAAALHPDGIRGWVRGLMSVTGIAGLSAQVFAALLPLRWLFVSRRARPGRFGRLSAVAVSSALCAGLVYAAVTAPFTPVGMHSAVLETDASGTFVESSFAWATGRGSVCAGATNAETTSASSMRFLRRCRAPDKASAPLRRARDPM